MMAGKIGSFFAIIFSVVMMAVAAAIFIAAGVLYENPGVMVLGIAVALVAIALLVYALVKNPRRSLPEPEIAEEDEARPQPVELVIALLVLVAMIWVMSLAFELPFLLPFAFIGMLYLAVELFARLRRNKKDGQSRKQDNDPPVSK